MQFFYSQKLLIYFEEKNIGWKIMRKFFLQLRPQVEILNPKRNNLNCIKLEPETEE